MNIYAVAVFLFFVSTSTSYAANVTKSDKIKELMKIQGLYEIIEQQKNDSQEQAKAIGTKMLQQLQKQRSEFDVPISDSIEKAYQHFLDMTQPTWMTEEAVAVYGELYGLNVTDEELDKIISFYKSPLGQKDVQATKNAMPLWTKFFTEKNNAVFEKATRIYFSELKAIVEKEKGEPIGVKSKH